MNGVEKNDNNQMKVMVEPTPRRKREP